MPYSADKYPDSWKNEPADVRAKAIEMVNAMLKDGMDEGMAIATALKKARSSMSGKKEMAEHSNAVRGVEIFSPGTHNGDAYTEADIDDMIAAHAELDFRPAIKIGHTKDAPGAPAYGWVTGLRKVGGKLVADFESMHDSVIAALKDRRYDRISSEVYFNLKRGGKQFRRALKAVALLGADVPAVAGLTPLHKMEFVAEGFDSVAACEQSLEIEKQALIDSLTERVANLTQTINQEKEQDAMTIKKLKEDKAALEAQLAALKQSDGADKAQVAKFEADLAAISTQIGTLESAERTEAENGVLKQRLAKLEQESRARLVSDKIGRCTIVAFRPELESIYEHALANEDVKVKVYAEKNGKRTESEKSLVEVVDALVTNMNAASKKLFSVETQSRNEQREDGPRDGDAGAEIDQKVQQRLADGKSKDYAEAMTAVFVEDPELAARYNEQQAARRQAN